MINFRTYTDLVQLIQKNIIKIPRSIDAIVAVPRSGYFPATAISKIIFKPVLSIGDLKRNEYYGSRLEKQSSASVKKILLVEDAITTGSTLGNAVKELANLKINVITLSCFVTEESKGVPDIYFEVLNHPRFFEWNWLTSRMMKLSLVDFDGILCEDPTSSQNDDGEKYTHFILNAAQKYIPKHRTVGGILSSRLKKYTRECKLWLEKHDIKYGEMTLAPFDNIKQRMAYGHARFKAGVYKESKFNIYVESDPCQAREIFDITRKPVFCPSNSMFLK